MILSLIISILTLVAEWMIFKKMGRQGWEGIVPFYNTYVLCQELYGNGWKFLLLLIPIYNIYFVIKITSTGPRPSIRASASVSAFCCCPSFSS